MTRPFFYIVGFFLIIAALITGCATTTELKAVWKDPAYAGHPNKIMVIGVSKNAVRRRIFEDEFVKQIKAAGSDAIASYTVLPDAKQDDQALIAEMMKKQGADTVLITRLVNKKTVQVYVPGTVYYPPPYHGTWRDYYGYGYHAIYTPGYMAEDEYALMETNLYDAAKDNLIWASSSQTEMRGSDQSVINSYIGVIVKTMAEQNLLGK